ncbi:class II histone deacetylase [Leucobacter sp. OLJS4]|uniref:class II histone deacetylase n=1 Tax=unclassified Leucobacter TaxID=2621730 RepID=UPI000C182AE7|nr:MULTISPECIES: class II histone deacetylase [unclassified Leucobacter]PII81630.1 class II histone deacetylase [Leucobacter sp. OLCALW19]PII86301.1 class II histone deacetylase [Leucobacter sp. OLTLW20]PII90196.1 class II histone deacetylase [Leucobacter sp. OLAS13]PII96613.1 class II histone deacetylase [Leucobacter sp. OLCS4]PII97229.1 class II histone deacetylase [Leucobacter sp. OLDS2]
MTQRTTGYVWHERYAWHDTGTAVGVAPSGGFNQPHQAFESPESKSRMAGLVEVSGLIDALVRIQAVEASDTDLLRVHTPEHVERIRGLSADRGGDAGDGYTPFGRGSFEIAKLAAGGTMAAVAAVMRGEVDNAYALVRPPGHHARREMGMGYCLFSNVCVAIEYARAELGVRRVAIVDYDVHHGNGAQQIYWDDPDVLAISIHQDRLFPQDTGSIDEIGGPGAEGRNINIPLPAGSGNGAYLAAIERVAVPAIRAFAPDLVIVSSGFDPSAVDPLGCMTVTSGGFKAMAERILEVAEEACGGRVVFSHEGGYSPVHVPFCGLAVLEALSGRETGVEDPFGASFDASPAHPLQPWQDEVVAQAEAIAERLGFGPAE